MLRINKQKTGFTLVELIIYFGIFSFLLLILTSVFTSSLSSQLESESLSSVEQDGRFILLRLARDIQSASSITVPANPGSNSSDLQLTIDGQNYIYSLSGDNLILTNNNGVNNLNNFNTIVSDLAFSRIGNPNGKNTIKISFITTTKTNLNGVNEFKEFETTIGTR